MANHSPTLLNTPDELGYSDLVYSVVAVWSCIEPSLGALPTLCDAVAWNLCRGCGNDCLGVAVSCISTFYTLLTMLTMRYAASAPCRYKCAGRRAHADSNQTDPQRRCNSILSGQDEGKIDGTYYWGVVLPMSNCL